MFSGIGRECAILFASEGANLILADINLEACQQTADIVNERFSNAELPVKAIAVKCDVSKEDEVAAIVKRAVDEFGRLDVMVGGLRRLFYAGVASSLTRSFALLWRFPSSTTPESCTLPTTMPSTLTRKSGTSHRLST